MLVEVGQVYKTRETVVTIVVISEDGVTIHYTESHMGVKNPFISNDVTRPKFEDWVERVKPELQPAPPNCKHCHLPIRETGMGRVRNEYEHMDGKSFCKDKATWAWPKGNTHASV